MSQGVLQLGQHPRSDPNEHPCTVIHEVLSRKKLPKRIFIQVTQYFQQLLTTFFHLFEFVERASHETIRVHQSSRNILKICSKEFWVKGMKMNSSQKNLWSCSPLKITVQKYGSKRSLRRRLLWTTNTILLPCAAWSLSSFSFLFAVLREKWVP